MSFSNIFTFLTSNELPPKILLLGGAIATLIVVTGISIWGILGAWKALMFLLSM